MKRISICLAILAGFSAVGCGPSRPDPRANPDFNEAALTDPGSVKMDSPAGKKR